MDWGCDCCWGNSTYLTTYSRGELKLGRYGHVNAYRNVTRERERKKRKKKKDTGRFCVVRVDVEVEGRFIHVVKDLRRKFTIDLPGLS